MQGLQVRVKVLSELAARLAGGLAVLAFALWPGTARAEQPSAAVSCESWERELTGTRGQLQRALEELQAERERASRLPQLRATIERLEQQQDETRAGLESSKASREALCTAAGRLVNGLAAGQVDVSQLGECVPPSAGKALAAQLSGWSNASAELVQLGAFASGDSDAAPGLRASSGTRVEKLVARLFAAGNGSPLIYRRLLVEALKLTAPNAVLAIRSQAGGFDRWFAVDEPLSRAIVSEAQGERQAAVDAQAGAFATASSLVRSYELLAGCARPLPARDCRRANQLWKMLEASEPLIERRKSETIWRSECSELTDDVVKRWLQDFEAGHAPPTKVGAVPQALQWKLLTCFLRDAPTTKSFRDWLSTKLPPPASLTPGTLSRVLDLERYGRSGSALDICSRAVRALQGMAPPSACTIPAEWGTDVEVWAASADQPVSPGDLGLEICERLARALWRGEAVTLPDSFAGPPAVDGAVRLLPDAPSTKPAQLRRLCGERAGAGASFERGVAGLGRLARSLGENVASPPWNLTGDIQPIERSRRREGKSSQAWLASLIDARRGCKVLQLTEQRCQTCRASADGLHYDCVLLRELEVSWSTRTRTAAVEAALGAALIGGVLWGLRLRRALKTHRGWLKQVSSCFRAVGIEARFERLRYLFPARMAHVQLLLPHTEAWARWGRHAVVVRCETGGFQERDVNRAGSIARRHGAELALLIHDEAVSPDLGAVRAMLEWTARGAGKSAHVLPLTLARLRWAPSASDLLELTEESSLRNNPFDLRGRVTSSAQFFNRERLVSGLLASVQTGRFTVITGLRRFGKSSLALEVARRLPGPSAYADLTGFHHEIHFSAEPSEAADAILRFLCLELLESGRARSPAGSLDLDAPKGKLDAATLGSWLRRFGNLLAEANGGTAPPALVILDELEHAIGAARQLNHALEVFAIVVGRLRNTLSGAASTRGQRVGVLFCSALHPLLWSPLSTLAHQSLVGSFERVAVPCLPRDAAAAMMRGLGSQQSIRFSEEALALLLRESQCVPLLLRRLGSAVLELYDPERARQGALGAVEIGVEGVRAAIEREVSEGSPLRVWIESEIAEAASPGGVVLRFLAQCEQGTATVLRRLAAEAFRRQFALTGLALEFTPGEEQRRAEEGAAVVVRALGESGLLRAQGDPTEPEAFELPSGVIRRVLACGSTPVD
jgi:hypothetical protein